MHHLLHSSHYQKVAATALAWLYRHCITAAFLQRMPTDHLISIHSCTWIVTQRTDIVRKQQIITCCAYSTRYSPDTLPGGPKQQQQQTPCRTA
jgi:hypothetical protein